MAAVIALPDVFPKRLRVDWRLMPSGVGAPSTTVVEVKSIWP